MITMAKFKFKTRDGKTPSKPTEDVQHNQKADPSDINKDGTPKFPHPVTDLDHLKAEIDRDHWK